MSEIHGATGAYVVGALDPDEVDEFEAHLAECATCRQEVVELCETAGELSLLAAAPPPPPGLRDAILAGITEVRQLPPDPGEPRRSEAAGEARPAPAVAPAGVPSDDGPVIDEVALRRASRRARLLSVLVAAVTVVALALAGVVYSLARQQPPVAGGPPVATAPQVDPSLLAAPDAKIYSVSLNGARASFVVSKSQNRAAFVSTDLPPAGPGNVYHLWTLKGKTIVRPDNTFTGGTQGTQVFLGPIADSTAVAVNIEPAGTTPQTPTTPVLASAAI